MKLVTAGATQAGRECRARCGATIAKGDKIVHQRFPNNPYGDRDVFWHAACVRAVLDGAPTRGAVRRARADREWASVKERVRDTGDVFA